MRTLIHVAAFVLIAAPLLANAQASASVAGKGPGLAAAARHVNITATITAIDKATREVTVKGPQGRELTVVAGPKVMNFAQMKVGDRVDVEYVEALSLELMKGGTAPVARSEGVVGGTAAAGKKPAAGVGHQVRVTATVVAVDATTRTVTLRGPRQTLDVRVPDSQQFGIVAVGDQVEATYTQALAVAVKPASAGK